MLRTRINGRAARPHFSNTRIRQRNRRESLPTGHQGKSSEPIVYQGKYGQWKVEDEDRLEVFGYRLGLNLAVAATVGQGLRAFLPEAQASSSLSLFLAHSQNIALFVGLTGFGASLQLIHVYVDPLKKMLQVFLALGVLGTIFISTSELYSSSSSAYYGVIDFVVDQRWTVWAVGPIFAALTGVSVKEGLCYGKFECAGLALLTPVLLLSHLNGATTSMEKILLAPWLFLMTVFAARKWTQGIEEDIGDKSVFMYIKNQRERNTGSS